MHRRHALSSLVALALAAARAGDSTAQSAAGITLIGLFDAGERLEWWEAFRQQMRELGYVEGRNVAYVSRYAKGNVDDLPALAREVVAQKVTVIVTGGSAAAVAAHRVTRKIPIVMGSGTDQISLGLAQTLARPGGNVTGVSSLNSELTVKRVELLREVVPKAARFAVLWHADNASSMASVREIVAWAAKARLGLESIGVRNSGEMVDAFTAMSQERVEAIVVVNSPFIFAERKRIAEQSTKHKLPAMYGASEYVDAGGLMSYAPSYAEMFRRAAIYVDRILKGANPATMPIEQPTTFELVINLSAARAIDVAMPKAMLSRANRVIQS